MDRRPFVRAEMEAMLEGVDPGIVEQFAGLVKRMHHATVDRALRDEFDWNPEGHHIDSRRMMLTAYLAQHGGGD